MQYISIVLIKAQFVNLKFSSTFKYTDYKMQSKPNESK